VSPQGKAVLIDGGLPGSDKAVNAYLASQQLDYLDYYVVSHYHRDHIGATAKILTPARIQHLTASYDRGDTPANTDSFMTGVSKNYRSALAGKRITANPNGALASAGRRLMLDGGSTQPVEIAFIAVNGDGRVTKSTINENDLSLACLVKFGAFSAELGGDLSGSNGSEYTDIETSLASAVGGPVTLIKVHHHGSAYSSNTNWLKTLNPVVGIICCGTLNTYWLPEGGALDRLAAYKVETYWTETGSKKVITSTSNRIERTPDGGKHQHVGGNIVVEVGANSDTFDLSTSNPAHTYTYKITKPPGDWAQTVSGGSAGPASPNIVVYRWSKVGRSYHVAGCSIGDAIIPNNLETGPIPPGGLHAHTCVK
ncbi:MAG TPA: MBL fold metallo-hydrolase, partial [Candidatus Dormibacteraeota bacterium]|nr:MBL fold metallo-hydrolase [Candidatus Dormibacteraeota bacterium]